MIEVQHISKYFNGIPAVKDISFKINEGEVFVLLGTSGSGKTTTLKMLNRLLDADDGKIFINGRDSTTEKPEVLRRKMGYVLQNIGLFPHYTVRENIALIPRLLKWESSKVEERSRILLQKFNLPPEKYLDLYPDQLSGGQQQRVGFTRALMANPPIILMDEPLGALDPITRKQIQSEFKKLDELKGKTIVLVTHDISEAIALGDRICLMDQGQIQQIGTAEELLFHPKNNFVEQFFDTDRLNFELSAIKIKQLLPFLPVNTALSEVITLDPETSVMTVLQAISRDKTRIVDSQFGSVGMKTLLGAFEDYLKDQRDGTTVH